MTSKNELDTALFLFYSEFSVVMNTNYDYANAWHKYCESDKLEGHQVY